jgi:hypothetical protein
MKETRTQQVTALIAQGYGASLVTYERDKDRDVQRVIVALTPADLPHLDAAIAELRRHVG